MLVGHLTDLHILADGDTLGGRVNTNALAKKAVESLNLRVPGLRFVVVTGDITHHGRLDQMHMARRILDGLSVPYFVIPGAHDETMVFREVFGDLPYMTDHEDVRYCIDEFPVRLIAVDTTRGKGVPPEFGTERLAWLTKTLSNAPSRPTLIAMHHPPFQCRIAVPVYLNDPSVTWAKALKESVSEFANVKLVICGHVHRSIQTLWAGSLLSVGPATCVQAEPRFDDFTPVSPTGKRAASLILEPPSYQLHWWDGSDFSTFTIFVEEFPKI